MPEAETTAAEVSAALDDLGYVVVQAPDLLRRTDAEAAAAPCAFGKWSPLQELGHLVDSALNNIQRLVRLQRTRELDLPGYDPDAWVHASGHGERPWPELIEAWTALNRHLLHIGRRLDPATLGHVWLHDGQRLTLAFIVVDYIRHLRGHLEHLVPGGCAAAAQGPGAGR